MNRKIKKEVLALLEKGDLDRSRSELAKFDEHGLVNPLFSALYRPEELLRWHTISIFGEVLSRLADKDMEAARIIMRRFIWSLNDESGGIGWGAPEAMAEAMFYHDRLCDEYHHMLISYMRPDGPLAHQDGNFLELPALQRGVLWGICRLAENRAPLLLEKEVAPDLFPYLNSPDATVRGLAVKGLGLLGVSDAMADLQLLLDDKQSIRLYHDGDISVCSISELSRSALEHIKGQF